MNVTENIAELTYSECGVCLTRQACSGRMCSTCQACIGICEACSLSQMLMSVECSFCVQPVLALAAYVC